MHVLRSQFVDAVLASEFNGAVLANEVNDTVFASEWLAYGTRLSKSRFNRKCDGSSDKPHVRPSE